MSTDLLSPALARQLRDARSAHVEARRRVIAGSVVAVATILAIGLAMHRLGAAHYALAAFAACAAGAASTTLARPLRDVLRDGKRLAEVRGALADAKRALGARSTTSIAEIEASLATLARRNPLAASVWREIAPRLERRGNAIANASERLRVARHAKESERRLRTRLDAAVNGAPVAKAIDHLDRSRRHLEARRGVLERQWKTAYRDFSWWNKIKYGPVPDLSGLDRTIAELESDARGLRIVHGDDLRELKAYADRAAARIASRLAAARRETERCIEEAGEERRASVDLLRKATLLSAMSVPVSLWMDVDRAAAVYDVLRSVNGSYADLSDVDIWFRTLTLPAESLAGLASLAKGAYFERLVASGTGGELHEHFGHPDTDIVVDGVAYQIKATADAAYVEGVPDDIPVIATTEVAEATGAVDGGHSHAELSDTVDLALGGTVIDVGDAGVDVVLAGLGGLGVFASLAGLNHAVQRYENGGDPVEAAFAGAGVAIERTARTVVGVAEFGYKALTSRPSRALGRGLYRTGATIVGKP